MTAQLVLITGGSGFIGSHIATRLVEEGKRVRVFDNFATSTPANLDHIRDDVQLIEGDLRDDAAVRAAVQGVDLIYHQGALASVPRSIADPKSSFDVNVTGTLNLLVAARDAGVRRLVFASSSSVYGDTQVSPKHERLTPAPLSPYAISKLTGEQLCTVFNSLYDLETVVLRYFNVFGPRQDPESPYAAVIPKFLAAMHRGEQPTIFGDGEQSRGFTYVEDVVRGNLLAGEVPAAAGKVMNVASDTSVSVNSLLQSICALLDRTVEADYQPPRPGDIKDSLADITLARETLGWQPAVPMAEGLRRTVEAFVVAYPCLPEIAGKTYGAQQAGKE